MPAIPTGTQLINPVKVLEAGRIREGQTVADLGCGALGHLVFPAARMVGTGGTVYAVDIMKSVLQSIESRKQIEETPQVKAVWGDIERRRGVKIADETVDLVLVVNNLFLAKERVEVGREAMRMLKSSGALVAVDWKITNTPIGPAAGERVEKEQAKLAMQTAGLRFVSEFEPGPYHYGLVFEKP